MVSDAMVGSTNLLLLFFLRLTLKLVDGVRIRQERENT
jgi:hypothetical protein